MVRYVALLQGINVGKTKRVAMSDLKALVEKLGYTDVRTHLNSGNVVFTSPEKRANDEIADAIEAAIRSTLGLDVPVVVRAGEEMRAIVDGNPFPEAAAEHKTLHVAFMSAEPDPELVAAMAEVERGEDDYRVVGPNVYLYFPNYLTGATFKPSGLDKGFGVTATSRNWRTVTRLAELAT